MTASQPPTPIYIHCFKSLNNITIHNQFYAEGPLNAGPLFRHALEQSFAFLRQQYGHRSIWWTPVLLGTAVVEEFILSPHTHTYTHTHTHTRTRTHARTHTTHTHVLTQIKWDLSFFYFLKYKKRSTLKLQQQQHHSEVLILPHSMIQIKHVWIY